MKQLDLFYTYSTYSNKKDLNAIELRNKLVQLNKGLVYKAAHIFKTNSEEFKDLSQEGFLGLIRAVEDFDCNLGIKFSSYAYPRITGKIMQYQRDRGRLIRLPQSIQALYSRIKKACKEIERPTPEKICKFLGITLDEYHLIIAAQNSIYYVPLDNESEQLLILEGIENSPQLKNEGDICNSAPLVKVDWTNLTNGEIAQLKNGNCRDIWLKANDWIVKEDK